LQKEKLKMSRQNKDIVLVIDLDGCICENNNGDYAKAKPIQENIYYVNKCYLAGYKIVICTARYGERAPGKQYQVGYLEAITWLNKQGVQFHELIMSKPPGAVYYDDKAVKLDNKTTGDEREQMFRNLEDLKNKTTYNQLIQENKEDTKISKRGYYWGTGTTVGLCGGG